MFISTQFECDIQQLDYSPLSSHPARSDLDSSFHWGYYCYESTNSYRQLVNESRLHRNVGLSAQYKSCTHAHFRVRSSLATQWFCNNANEPRSWACSSYSHLYQYPVKYTKPVSKTVYATPFSLVCVIISVSPKADKTIDTLCRQPEAVKHLTRIMQESLISTRQSDFRRASSCYNKRAGRDAGSQTCPMLMLRGGEYSIIIRDPAVDIWRGR